ncbi:unnamed protein product [Rotaria sp. Silwood2]|nr:unnamed protein product [Rotaria sp. Silwood2]CAF4266654.1 unnamed protein product [Rotaria sp. Silwood2]
MVRVKVSLEKKIDIKILLQVGFSQRHVAQTCGVSKTCAFRVAQKLKQKLPLSNLLDQCPNNSSSYPEYGVQKVIQKKKTPYRKPAQRKQRLSFAQQHQYWLNEWNNIIWSDEAHFEVFNRKNRTYARRLTTESCISGAARGPLVMYSGNVNGSAYIKIIEEALPMFIENTFDPSNKNWAFMPDNAPPHISKYVMKWCKDNQIDVLKWPATSPDLNRIENLWDHIDKELRKMKPKNVIELQDMIQDI